MIPRADLPAISNILTQLDVPPGRRGRTQCPIHRGDNSQAFSYDDDKGQWFCFRCGIGGDAIELVKKALQLDFRAALQWLGLKPDFLKAPDPAVVRRQKARAGLEAWAKDMGQKLRFEFYTRERVITRALRRLRQNPEDEWGWNWLGWALTGHAALEHKLDMIDIGTEEQRLEAYKQMRNAA